MTRVKCPKCGYEWETRSRLAYVTCPNCLRKVRVKTTTVTATSTTMHAQLQQPSGELPEFARDNPWLEVLSRKT